MAMKTNTGNNIFKCSTTLLSVSNFYTYLETYGIVNSLLQCWNRLKGNVEETSETGWSTYRLFWVHRSYNLELNWTETLSANLIQKPFSKSVMNRFFFFSVQKEPQNSFSSLWASSPFYPGKLQAQKKFTCLLMHTKSDSDHKQQTKSNILQTILLPLLSYENNSRAIYCFQYEMF